MYICNPYRNAKNSHQDICNSKWHDEVVGHSSQRSVLVEDAENEAIAKQDQDDKEGKEGNHQHRFTVVQAYDFAADFSGDSS